MRIQKRSDANDPNAVIQAAMTALGTGRATQAESLYQSLAATHPSSPDTHMCGGVIAMRTGRPDAALLRFGRVVAAHPDHFAALSWHSIALREVGRFSEALDSAKRANRIRPNDPEVLFNIAQCHMELGETASAIDFLEMAISIRPNEARYYARIAEAYRLEGRDLDSLASLRAAIHLAPEYRGYLQLADLLETLGKPQEAVDAYKKALAIQGESALVHLHLSRALTDCQRHEEAEAHLNRAAELEPLSSQVGIRRGFALQQFGKFAEAEAEFHRVIAADPTVGIAYHGIASARRITEADREFIDAMESAAARPDLTVPSLAYVRYALGKAFDNLGDYVRAMAEYDEANRAAKIAEARKRPFDREALAHKIDTRIELFTREFFSSREREREREPAPIFIVGMLRSGTTLAEQILSCHPDVAAAGELSYWANTESRIVDFRRGALDLHELPKAASEYRDLLQELSGGKPFVTDKNPANSMFLGVIHAAYPDARIIRMRRNAADTALSIYMTPVRTPPDFALDKENIVFSYEQYLRLMAHWRETLPSDRYLEIQYEELVSNGEPVVRQLVDFCGLRWDDACLHPENNFRSVHTPSFWQVRQPLYTTSIQRWQKYRDVLGAFERLVDAD